MKKTYRKILDDLFNAQEHLGSAEHLIFVSFPITKDPKILVNALISLKKSSLYAISNALKIEKIRGNKNIGSDKEKNFSLFFDVVCKSYEIDSKSLMDLIDVASRHEHSGFEFSKKESLYILNDDLSLDELNLERVKIFFETVNDLCLKVEREFRNFFQKGI